MNSVRKEFKPLTLLIRDKEGNIVIHKEKVLKGGLNIMRRTLNWKMEQTVTEEKNG
jgi:C4-type Zn-finger protein